MFSSRLVKVWTDVFLPHFNGIAHFNLAVVVRFVGGNQTIWRQVNICRLPSQNIVNLYRSSISCAITGSESIIMIDRVYGVIRRWRIVICLFLGSKMVRTISMGSESCSELTSATFQLFPRLRSPPWGIYQELYQGERPSGESDSSGFG